MKVEDVQEGAEPEISIVHLILYFIFLAISIWSAIAGARILMGLSYIDREAGYYLMIPLAIAVPLGILLWKAIR